MKAILLTIYPEYIEEILTGRKAYEYRKNAPKSEITHVVFYVTVPVGKIVAVACVENIIEKPPYSLWEETKYASGISRRKLMDYLHGCNTGCAIKLGQVMKFVDAPNIGASIPRSYSYLTPNDAKKISLHPTAPAVGRCTLFLGGIHGSGKDTICDSIFKKMGFDCHSASGIIVKLNGEVNKDKVTKNIKRNQELLLNGISMLEKESARLLINGHFCLINRAGKIERIAFDIFKQISPKAIFLLTATTHEIVQRLKNRDGEKLSREFIKEFQEAELNYAKEIAQKLNVPFLCLRSSDAPYVNYKKIRTVL